MKRKRRRDDPARRTYSVEEAREILGVSASTIRRLISLGSVPVVGGLGRIKRVPKWWVDEQVGRRSDESE